ncbi:MAG TPA: hypothetical protein VF622_19685 [Segetibacter sp.]|jgi:hypothetical protein
MKKIILSLCILVAATTFATAQGQGGQSQADRQAQMKQTLKDSLGLTDEQAQIVLDVQAEFRPKMMEVRNLAEADRPAKMQEINTEMNKKLASALKDGALARKVIEFNLRRRGGGGRPQGGGGNN